MAEALLWGLVAGSSLLVGGALAPTLSISRLVLGLIMAFGAGVLISAVAYDLVEEAVATSAGGGGVALGLFAGALTFFAGDAIIDRLGGAEHKDSGGGAGRRLGARDRPGDRPGRDPGDGGDRAEPARRRGQHRGHRRRVHLQHPRGHRGDHGPVGVGGGPRA